MDPRQPAPRRARDDRPDAFDAHELLLIAIEQLAVDFTAEGRADSAARLRALARQNV